MAGTNEEGAAKLRKLSTDNMADFQYFESSVFTNDSDIIYRMNNDGVMITLKNMTLTYSEQLLQTLNDSLYREKYDAVLGDEVLVSSLLCIHSQWNIPAIIVGNTLQMLISKVFVKPVFDFYILRSHLFILHKFCPSITKQQLYDAGGVHLPHIVPTVIGFEFPRTLTPLITYVGPIIPESPVPLSKDPSLSSWLQDQPEQSVVYLSMGSIFPLDKETAKCLFEGVMATKYSILWALRKNNQWVLDGLAIDKSRVYISEWTPQFSVLASKAIHSAILHGGFNGLSEALWNGIPVIGFPQTIEQDVNVGRLYHSKFGVRLNRATLNSADVAEAINTINNGSYRSNIKKLQKMFGLAGGLDRIVDLIEFYGEEGYDHLIPAYAKYQWTWVQYYNADVWGIMAIIVIVIIAVMVKLLNCLCRAKPSKEKIH